MDVSMMVFLFEVFCPELRITYMYIQIYIYIYIWGSEALPAPQALRPSRVKHLALVAASTFHEWKTMERRVWNLWNLGLKYPKSMGLSWVEHGLKPLVETEFWEFKLLGLFFFSKYSSLYWKTIG